MRPGRFLAGTVVVGGLAFGYAGGEYSTGDWRTLRDNVATERAMATRLQIEIDSLRREADGLETDPMAQEWAARERFGMLRSGEMMYRIEEVSGEAGRDEG